MMFLFFVCFFSPFFVGKLFYYYYCVSSSSSSKCVFRQKIRALRERERYKAPLRYKNKKVRAFEDGDDDDSRFFFFFFFFGFFSKRRAMMMNNIPGITN